MNEINDPVVRLLAHYSQQLKSDYENQWVDWDNSPFGWIKKLPSRSVGAIGEKILSGYLAAKGFDIARSPDSDADRIVGGKRAEIKMSTLWKEGNYVFQQIRNNQDNRTGTT